MNDQEKKAIRVLLIISLSILISVGCHKELSETESFIETSQQEVDAEIEINVQDTTEFPTAVSTQAVIDESEDASSTTEPAPTEPKETYSPSDIRTRTPEVGETYYTEQVIEESKDEALALTQEILDNPGKVFVLGEGYANPLEILLDVDVDGVPERIALSCHGEDRWNYRCKEIDGIPYVGWEMYLLSVGETSFEVGRMGSFKDSLNDQLYRWNVLAFSPDGERILLALTEAISEEELQGNYTHIVAYNGEKLTLVLDDAIDLLGENTVIGKDNLIALRDPFDPFDSRVRFEWKMDADGVYQRHYAEMYDFVDECIVMVNKPIVIYAEPDPDAEEVATINQQQVMVKKSEMVIERDRDDASSFFFDGKINWIYLETMDCVGGWIQVSDAVQLADGEWEQVFLVFTSGNSGQ